MTQQQQGVMVTIKKRSVKLNKNVGKMGERRLFLYYYIGHFFFLSLSHHTKSLGRNEGSERKRERET